MEKQESEMALLKSQDELAQSKEFVEALQKDMSLC